MRKRINNKRYKCLLISNKNINNYKNLYSNILILLISFVLSTNLLYSDIVISGGGCNFQERQMGQSFTITTPSLITSLSFNICWYLGAPPKTYTFFFLSGNTNVGTALYTQSFTIAVSIQGARTINLTTPLSLSSGTYTVIFSAIGLYTSNTNVYSGGNLWDQGSAQGGDLDITIATTPLVVPTLTSTIASSVTSAVATSGGNISSDGGASVTARGVVWSTSVNPTVALSTKTSDGTGNGAFTSAITGLSPSTKYYYRSYATNSVGTTYGSESNFTTNASSVVTLDAPSTLTTDKIIIAATAVSDGGASISERGIVLSKLLNPTISSDTKHTDIGTGLGTFSSTFSDLTSGTKYYLRSYTINSDGISYSNNSIIYTIDNDGYSEAEENKSPNGDGNGDGIADASQENVVSFSGVNENIYTIACLNTNQIINNQNYSMSTNSGYTYPYGVFAYTINASSATVTIYFHGTSSLSNYVYRKLSATGRWINFEKVTFGYTYINNIKTATATLVLTDGDPASDADGVRNGVIIDPGGPAFLDSPANIPVWDWKYVVLLMSLFGVWVFKSKIV